MNTNNVVKGIPNEITKEVNGIKFNIRKKIENDFIKKEIKFEDDGQQFSFTEEVRILLLEDFYQFYIQAGLEVISIYGDYNLNDFDEHESPRLIMLTRKI